MKGITSNPALDAYQRAALRPVAPSPSTQGTSGGGAEPQAGQAAKVSISSEARALATGAAGPPVDTQKIEALKASIETNNFQVNSQSVAQKILGGLG